MQSSIQIMLDAERPRDGIAVCAAVDADLKKLADTFAKSAEGDWPNAAASTAHYHLRRQVAMNLIMATVSLNIREEVIPVIEAALAMAYDVDGTTDNLELEGEVYAAADWLEKAYTDAIETRREERDRAEEDDRPTHPDRAAFGRGAL